MTKPVCLKLHWSQNEVAKVKNVKQRMNKDSLTQTFDIT
jgi:hypothetical protein